MSDSTDVLVVGGGIGGLTTALCLARTGRTVQVLERSPAFGEIGAGLQLAPNATRILDRLGLLDAVRQVGVLPRRLVLSDAITTEELTYLPVEDFPDRYGGPYVVMHRSDLLQILLDACRQESVALETGSTVQQVDEDETSVHAVTTEGAHHAASVAIAADGLNSRLRQRFAQDEPVNSGYVAYRGAVPMADVQRHADLRDVVAWIGPGLHLVQYPLRSGQMYNQVAVFRSQAWDKGDPDWGNPAELDATFAPTSEHVRESARLLGRDHRWPMYDRMPIRNWVSGRIALMGDAAHPMLQYLAQGACQSIEDAWAIAAALGSSDRRDPGAALRAYEAGRTPHTGRVQTTARIWGDIWHIDGIGRLIRNELLRSRRPDDHTHVAWLYGSHPAAVPEAADALSG